MVLLPFVPSGGTGLICVFVISKSTLGHASVGGKVTKSLSVLLRILRSTISVD